MRSVASHALIWPGCRLRLTSPRLIVADPRNADVLGAHEHIWFDDASHTPPPPAEELQPDDPCLITFTSGTSGEPKAVLHGQRYLTGQRLQAEHWLAPDPNQLVIRIDPRPGARLRFLAKKAGADAALIVLGGLARPGRC